MPRRPLLQWSLAIKTLQKSQKSGLYSEGVFIVRDFNTGKEEHLAKIEGLYSEGIVIVMDLIARDYCICYLMQEFVHQSSMKEMQKLIQNTVL